MQVFHQHGHDLHAVLFGVVVHLPFRVGHDLRIEDPVLVVDELRALARQRVRIGRGQHHRGGRCRCRHGRLRRRGGRDRGDGADVDVDGRFLRHRRLRDGAPDAGCRRAAGRAARAIASTGLPARGIPAIADRRSALAAPRMRAVAGHRFRHQRIDRLQRVAATRAHLVQHEAAELVGLQFDRRLAATGLDGVAGKVVAGFVGHDADRRPGIAAGFPTHQFDELRIERDHPVRQLLLVEQDRRRGVRHVGFGHVEVLRQAGERHHLFDHVAAIAWRRAAHAELHRPAIVGTGLQGVGDLRRDQVGIGRRARGLRRTARRFDRWGLAAARGGQHGEGQGGNTHARKVHGDVRCNE